jgi:ABC-type Fe3+/spermidine/putrescine transport system ATPase subunit
MSEAAPAVPRVQLQGVDKAFGTLPVLRGCVLDVRQGEVMTLLGPSGCGKTTLLRVIAGLVSPDAGSVSIGGRDVTWVPANRRQVGMVFQHYALFPHMTVFGNVAYGLRVRRAPRDELGRRVRAALALVELEALAERWPGQLSGGQQQRVALARALVLEPQVLLLDEPFGALDAKLREAMQVDLKKLVQRLGITTVFVTHDQDEALTLSDRIAVMQAGQITQVGSPLQIYDRPANAYVADFVGRSNLIEGVAAGGRVELGPAIAVPAEGTGPVTVVVRPEHLAVSAETGRPGWAGILAFVKHAGATTEYEVDVGRDRPLRVVAMREAGADRLAVGARVVVELRNPAGCVVLPGRAGA